MMWKDKISTSSVNVDNRPKSICTHCTALNMPTRATGAPRAVPLNLALLCALPQSEVGTVFLAGIDGNTFSSTVVFQISAGKGTVAVQARDIEIHIPVQRVCVAVVDYSADHLDNVFDIFGDFRFDGGWETIECSDIGVEFGDETLSEFVGVDSCLRCTLDDLIVHIGEVPHVRHVVTSFQEMTIQDVEGHIGTCVADMAIIIHGHSTHIHAYSTPLPLARLEHLLLLAHSVEHHKLCAVSLIIVLRFRLRGGCVGVCVYAQRRTPPSLLAGYQRVGAQQLAVWPNTHHISPRAQGGTALLPRVKHACLHAGGTRLSTRTATPHFCKVRSEWDRAYPSHTRPTLHCGKSRTNRYRRCKGRQGDTRPHPTDKSLLASGCLFNISIST
mmetsp:Transcript_9993/g.20865  ORF Transcript_9993/g.20865 Transcript_9993/m.20865 type:complete len:386 (+) Transcript_9993:943-2100(+)